MIIHRRKIRIRSIFKNPLAEKLRAKQARSLLKVSTLFKSPSRPDASDAACIPKS